MPRRHISQHEAQSLLKQVNEYRMIEERRLANHMKSKHVDFMQLQGLTTHKQLPEKVQ
jgi:hypothetical protein